MRRIELFMFFLLLTACNEASTPGVKELHHKYMTASIEHNIEMLSEMTHEDVVWQLGPYTFEGKEAALGPNRYDTGTGTILEYDNVVIRGDTVEFELLERNEILTAIGMERVRHYPRFIFKDGLVIRKESWKKSPDIQEMNRRLQPMRNWIRKNHPDAIEKLLDSDRNLIFNRENGELQVRLAREWEKTF